MKTFRFFNDADPNYTFDVEAKDEGEALTKAIQFLGWNGPCLDEDSEGENGDEA